MSVRYIKRKRPTQLGTWKWKYAGRELNPGLARGRGVCYHYTTGVCHDRRKYEVQYQTMPASLIQRSFIVYENPIALFSEASLSVSVYPDPETKSRNGTCSITCNEKSSMPLKHCARGAMNKRLCPRRNIDCNRSHRSMWIWVPPSQTRQWHWKQFHRCSRLVKSDRSKPSGLLVPCFLRKT